MITKSNERINFSEHSNVCNTNCQVSNICANHKSANIERKQDGMTPNIIWDTKLGSWACRKVDTKISCGLVKYNTKKDKIELEYQEEI